MPRAYNSSKSVASITYWRKFAQHRFIYLLLAGVFAVGIVAYFGTMSPMGGGGGRMDQRQRTEQTIATVNGEKISRGAYDSQWERFKRFGGGGNELQSVSMQGMLLGNLIDTAIATSAAKKKGLTVSDADIDKQIADMKKGGDGKPIPEKEFQDRLALQGITLQELKDDLRQSLLPKVLNESITNSVKVAEPDLLKSYNEIKVRHILVSTSKLPEEQAKRKAEKLLAEVKSGKDFATLANQNTDDPGNKQPQFDPKTKKSTTTPKGGLYDWSPATRYVPEFTAAALALKPGEVSDPVKTSFGYHIIKLLDTRQNLPKDYAKNKAKLLEDYKKQQGSQAVGKFMDEQKKTAKVVWEDPSLEWRYDYSKTNSMMGMQGGGAAALAPKLQAYIAKNPDDSAAAMILGQQMYTQYIMSAPGPGKIKVRDEVIGYYETALKHGEDQQTRLTLAQLYRDAKKNDDALRHYSTLARLLKWDDSAQTKYTHMQLEKAFKDLGKPELAEKETVRIAQLTVEEKKKAEEMKKQQEEAKKKAVEDKNKKAAERSAKPAIAAPGGTITINPDPKKDGAKPETPKDDKKPEAPKPADKKQ